jgi:hypothetical protein
MHLFRRCATAHASATMGREGSQAACRARSVPVPEEEATMSDQGIGEAPAPDAGDTAIGGGVTGRATRARNFGWVFLALGAVMLGFPYLLYRRDRAGDAAGVAAV